MSVRTRCDERKRCSLPANRQSPGCQTPTGHDRLQDEVFEAEARSEERLARVAARFMARDAKRREGRGRKRKDYWS